MTLCDSEIHHRRSFRLHGYDYSQAGAYFVTICVRDRLPILGTVVDDRLEHTDLGRAVVDCWQWLPTRYLHVALDEWIVMPNHLHGIIVIGDANGGLTSVGRRKPLGQLVGAFKTVSTQRVNRLRNSPGVPLWQRDFYEHIIRNEAELQRIRKYIVNNPRQWATDRENPAAERWQTDDPCEV